MRPEAARVQREIGRRLVEAGSATTFRDRDARSLLDEARRAFENLDLRWTLRG